MCLFAYRVFPSKAACKKRYELLFLGRSRLKNAGRDTEFFAFNQTTANFHFSFGAGPLIEFGSAPGRIQNACLQGATGFGRPFSGARHRKVTQPQTCRIVLSSFDIPPSGGRSAALSFSLEFLRSLMRKRWTFSNRYGIFLSFFSSFPPFPPHLSPCKFTTGNPRNPEPAWFDNFFPPLPAKGPKSWFQISPTKSDRQGFERSLSLSAFVPPRPM